MIYLEYSEKDLKTLEVWGDKTDFYCLYHLLLDITNIEDPILIKFGITDFDIFHDFIRGIRKAHYGQRLIQHQSKLSRYDHEEVGFEINFFQFIYAWSCLKINIDLVKHAKLLDSFVLMIDHFIERVIYNNKHIENPEFLLTIINMQPMQGSKYHIHFLENGGRIFTEEKDITVAFSIVTDLLKASSPLSSAYKQAETFYKDQQ